MSDTSFLLPLFAAVGGITDPMLSVIAGAGRGGDAGGDPVQALDQAQRIEPQEVQITAQQPSVARDIAAFENAVRTAQSPTRLLADPNVQKVLLTASGMSDQIGFTALVTQALLSDPADPNALVNHLSDTRWQTLNATYQFAKQGLSVIQNPKVLADVANAYAEQSWLQSLDATTPGLSNALAFLSQASTITSVSQILGNPLFFSVVTTALGIPIEIALQDEHAQEQAIGERLDVGQFSQPNFVKGLADRYMIAMQQSAAPAGGVSLESLAVQAGLVV